MKKVLSLLVAFIFLQVQTWALSGGPDYSKGQGANPNRLVGVYSGVLIPETTTTGGVVVATSSATIGLFSVAVPSTGLATGQAAVFVNGAAFTGNMVAFADPDNATLDGVFAGTSSFDVVLQPATREVIGGVVVTTPAITGPISAQGSVQANVVEGFNGAFTGGSAGTTSTFFSTTTTDVGTNFAARLEGSAQIDTFLAVDANGTPVVASSTTFTIDGVKQSNTSTTTTGTGGFFILF
jgi:hypothetical protein